MINLRKKLMLCAWPLPLLLICGEVNAVDEIHPGVFRLAIGWTSDTGMPIASEINLTAIPRSRNQFDPDKIWHRDGWTGISEHNSEIKYRIENNPEKENGKVTFTVQLHDSGSAVEQYRISGSLSSRSVDVSGQKTDISVLRIDGIMPLVVAR